MYWRVELQYETMSGNPASRVYHVTAVKHESAIKLAQAKLERMKSFKKHYAGNAIQVEKKIS